MFYCLKCQTLNSEKICPLCGSKKLREPMPDDPVLLITVDESKAETIESAFKDHGLPYEKRICGLDGPSSAPVGGSAYTNKNVFVPYEKLEAARELLTGMGIADIDDGSEEMSPRKKVFWRIISAILFILAVWGVVTVADYAANLLKNLLSNL